MLGALYVLGNGVAEDYVRAHMWFNLAAAAGNSDAAKNRDGLEMHMTREQIAEAQAMARKCEASGYKQCD